MSKEIDEKQVKKVFFDLENPNSLINRVWPSLVPYIQAVADVYPQHLLANETKVKGFCDPDERDLRIRLKFWDEYYMATAQDRYMELRGVLAGVATSETWTYTYLNDRRKMLWLITQPVSYTANMRSLLEKGLTKLHEIMDMPLVSRSGAPDIKMITQVLKAFQLVDLRVKGSVVQRMQIDQRSVNFNVDSGGGESSQHLAGSNYSGMSLEQLRQVEDQLDRIARKREKVVQLLPESDQSDLVEAVDLKIPMKVEMTYDDRAEDSPRESSVVEAEFAEVGGSNS